MLKRFAKRIALNFKQTRSERSANLSYSNYHQRVKRLFTKVDFFKRVKK